MLMSPRRRPYLAWLALIVVLVGQQWLASERQRVRDAQATRDSGELRALVTWLAVKSGR